VKDIARNFFQPLTLGILVMSAQLAGFFENNDDAVVRAILADQSAPTSRSGCGFRLKGKRLTRRLKRCEENKKCSGGDEKPRYSFR
jgi:hypothetical protein